MGAPAFEPDAPITFSEAAETLLRGLVTASTLRAAADRGDLVVERIGKRLVTTPAAVRDWRRKCRVSAGVRISISSDDPKGKASGTFETENGVSQQDAALAMLKGLAKPSSDTSGKRLDLSSATVIPLASRSQP